MPAVTSSRRRRRAAVVGLVAGACLLAGAGLVRANSWGTDQRRASVAPTAPMTSTTHAPAGTQVLAPEAQTEDGASEVAVRVVAASQDWLYLSDDEVRAAVQAVATTAAGPALADLTVADVSAARSDLGLSPGPVWWVVHPLAARVAAFTPREAEVEVWAVTVLAAVDVAAPQTEWLTVTVDLAWGGGRWRVESIRDRPGPSPMLGPRDQPWDAAPVTDALDGFSRLEGGPLEAAVGP
jgi:hypothetical protein